MVRPLLFPPYGCSGPGCLTVCRLSHCCRYKLVAEQREKRADEKRRRKEETLKAREEAQISAVTGIKRVPESDDAGLQLRFKRPKREDNVGGPVV